MPMLNLAIIRHRIPVAAALAFLAFASSACQSGASAKSTQKPLPHVEAVPVARLDLSVDQAYAAIPHRRTAMQFSGSKVPDDDLEYLRVAFATIDQAILLRVTTYQSFSRGKTADALAITRMDRIITFLQSIDPPPNLKAYHQRIQQAVSDQRAFFDDWRAHGSDFQYGKGASLASHAKVASSSSAIKEAYAILMKNYPNENAHNKDAFFDYHCALDFL